MGNETADSLAEEGTRRATHPGQGLSNLDLNARISTRNFTTKPHTTPQKRARDAPNPPHTPARKKARAAKQTRPNFKRSAKPAA